MDRVSRSKILLIIIGILLLANVGLLLYAFGPQRRAPEKHQGLGVTALLRDKIGFDQNQMKSFEEYKKDHFARIRPMMDDIAATKQTFYRHLHEENPVDSLMNLELQMIGEKQKELDMQIFQHFRRVRGLCTENQRPAFDSLFPQIIKKMTTPPQRKK
jgi:periplasmic protein CpxP/Spy